MIKIMKADCTNLEVDIRKGVAEIFSDGFGQWLTYFSKDSTTLTKAFAHMFRLDTFYVAILNNKVIGMVSCTDQTTRSVKLNKKELRKHLGYIKGSIAGHVLIKEFEAPFKNPQPHTGSIEFVGIAKDARGQGIASKMIQYIIENTPYNRYVIEEVANTNTAAMNLYNKLGFQEYRKTPLPKKRAKKAGIEYYASFVLVKEA